ncbi:MAG: hypothetical protein JXB48_04275 [Candidatus Latescibacteria bacterium]|nr:hypothetical protein [Candidatus Latescibacterota bacterium]
MERKEINVLEYFLLLYKARNFILLNFIIVCALAAIISFILPKYYISKAVLMPPRDTQKAFGFADVLAQIPITTLRLGTKGSPSELYMGILRSQTVGISIVDRFNLVDAFGVPNRDLALNTLNGMTNVTLSREGLIDIIVEDRDPIRAANIANMYVALLDSMNQIINQRASRERADFIEQQILENDIALTQAEMELREFQLRTNAISPIQQARIALSVSAELELDIMNKENTLKEYRSKSYKNSHPLVSELLNSIRFREEQLHSMRFGSAREDRESLFIPLQNAPDLNLQYTKLSRRVEILGTLEELLRQHYEESRIQQKNTTSTVTILDRARPAINKSRPKRKMIILVAGAASIFFSLVSIITIEYVNKLSESSPENQEKVARLARFLRIES